MEANVCMLAATGLVAGFLGSLLGIGGGFFVIPILSLILHLPLQVAIGTSLISVVATSSVASISYIKSRLTNVRLAVVLESATTIGAVVGAFVAVLLSPSVLSCLFGAILFYISATMAKRPRTEIPRAFPADGILDSYFRDPALGQTIVYRVRRFRIGMAISVLAGMVSGLLGVGGGVIKVPVMNVIMGVPIKPAVGTSSLMIGITAVASAFVYYHRGYIYPSIVAPVVIGILLGAWLGPRLTSRASGLTLRRMFAGISVAVGILMFLKAAGIVV
jgi:hypothetical protein